MQKQAQGGIPGVLLPQSMGLDGLTACSERFQTALEHGIRSPWKRGCFMKVYRNDLETDEEIFRSRFVLTLKDAGSPEKALKPNWARKGPGSQRNYC